jgi:hypothetical protein
MEWMFVYVLVQLAIEIATQLVRDKLTQGFSFMQNDATKNHILI